MINTTRRPRRKPTGRPTKLDARRIEIICKAIREGLYFTEACACAAVDKSTAYRWLARGEKQKSGPFRAFHDAVEKAEAEGERLALAKIRKAARLGTWQAAAWLLERRHPGRWARRTVLGVEDQKNSTERLLSLVRAIGGDTMLGAVTQAIEKISREEIAAELREELGITEAMDRRPTPPPTPPTTPPDSPPPAPTTPTDSTPPAKPEGAPVLRAIAGGH